MSKAYPSNLTHAQYEFVSDMIPEPKSGGRPREVDGSSVVAPRRKRTSTF
jgi:hypothetical protein